MKGKFDQVKITLSQTNIRRVSPSVRWRKQGIFTRKPSVLSFVSINASFIQIIDHPQALNTNSNSTINIRSLFEKENRPLLKARLSNGIGNQNCEKVKERRCPLNGR